MTRLNPLRLAAAIDMPMPQQARSVLAPASTTITSPGLAYFPATSPTNKSSVYSGRTVNAGPHTRQLLNNGLIA